MRSFCRLDEAGLALRNPGIEGKIERRNRLSVGDRAVGAATAAREMEGVAAAKSGGVLGSREGSRRMPSIIHAWQFGADKQRAAEAM